MRAPVRDVIVILPGILGSCLERNGTAIWGTPRSCAAALANPNRLALPPNGGYTDDPDVKAVGLVGAPGQYPGLIKIDLYTDLLENLQQRLDLNPDNHVVFAYDWRLSGLHNAHRLNEVVDPLLERRRHLYPDAKITLVCHSMGGIVAQCFTDHPQIDRGADVRSVITFGTPFRGAAKALAVLAKGWPPNLPVLRRRLRRLARTLPSVHDLLPRYKALTAHTHLRQPTSQDFASFTDPRHLEQSNSLHAALDHAAARPYRRVVIAGTQLATPQYLTLDGDHATIHSGWHPPGGGYHDEHGDGTVPTQSTTPPEWADGHDTRSRPYNHISLPLTHDAAIDIANAITARRRVDQDAPTTTQIAITTPDILEPEQPLVANVYNTDPDQLLLVTITDTNGQALRPPQSPQRQDGQLTATFRNLEPATYRLHVHPAAPTPTITPTWDITTIIDPNTLPADP